MVGNGRTIAKCFLKMGHALCLELYYAKAGKAELDSARARAHPFTLSSTPPPWHATKLK